MSLLRSASLAVLTSLLLPLTCFAQDSLNITRLRHFPMWHNTNDLVVAGDLAYVAAGTMGLQIVDLSDPAVPAVIGSMDSPEIGSQVAVSGNYAYLATGGSGLQVIDVSSPSSPFEVGIVFPDTVVQGVHVDGSLMFVYYRPDDRWTIFDIGNPAAPQYISNLTGIGFSGRIATQDSLAFVLHWSGMVIYDFSNPAAPVQWGSWWAGASDYSEALTVSGDYAYVSTLGNTLRTINASNPAAPVETASLPIQGVGTDLAVEGTRLYVTTWNDSVDVQIFDISNPAQPVPLGTFETPCYSAVAVVSAPGRVYFVSSCASLHILDTSGPVPMQLGYYDTPSSIYRLQVAGNYGYGMGGFFTFDLSDPLRPVMLGRTQNGDCVPPLVVQGSYAYTAAEWSDGPLDQQGGLRIVDISDPPNPVIVGSIYNPMDIGAIAVANGKAYATTGGWGISIIDVSNPAAPDSIGFFADLSVAPAVAAEDTVLFYGRTFGGLFVIDVSDPAAPVEIAELPTMRANSDMLLAGDLLYGVSDSGLFIANVADPAAPVLVGSYLVTGFYGNQRLDLQGSVAYLSDRYNGVRAVDVTNPADPVLAGYYETTGNSWDISVRDSLIYVPAGDHLDIYRFGPPLSITDPDIPAPSSFGLSAYPNPFNSASTFLMEVPAGVKVITVAVFDVLGREVRKESRPVTSARMVYRFDGAELASGVYFARVEAAPLSSPVEGGRLSATQKLLLLK